MDCIIPPVSMWRRSRLGYRPLLEDGFAGEDTSLSPVKVVVGKEKREFLVDPFVLEVNPFRVLMEMVRKSDEGKFRVEEGSKRVIFVDVDAILFEHLLWLMNNDSSSLFKLNLKEIIDFYNQDF
ncbi:hypothetical protein RJ641_035150 [Dillenia turbinata]|uniref:Uncharacterized protein n=1 Tax=Dillenia turbinata TaxID=194707 RepID=A0AAN8ZHY5_9MAGN